MAGSILVAYATRYGSTGEVAEAVAARLREHGLDAEVKPAREVHSIGGFAGVVLGAPIYIGSMLKEAVAFLEQNRAALERTPVAVFTLGPLSAETAGDDPRSQLDGALAKVPWLKPAAAEIFVGKYDPSKLRLSDKLIAALPASPLHGVTAHDERDWTAIGAWADGLPAALQLETPAAR